MPAVVAVMLIAACDPDLIRCLPVFHWEQTWETVQTCRRNRAKVTHVVLQRYQGNKTVMTECRLFLDEDRRFTAPAPNGPPGESGPLLY